MNTQRQKAMKLSRDTAALHYKVGTLQKQVAMPAVKRELAGRVHSGSTGTILASCIIWALLVAFILVTAGTIMFVMVR